jgi:hypothetical protein
VAWIIGWDLILEYAIGNVGVAISWANYFHTWLETMGIEFPRWLAIDYGTAVAKMPDLVAQAPHVFGIPSSSTSSPSRSSCSSRSCSSGASRESASFNLGWSRSSWSCSASS